MVELKNHLGRKTESGQDGAIFGDRLFRFDARGRCIVYDITLDREVSRFELDKNDAVCPHANAVCFGSERFDEGDELPVLYSNMYNNRDADGRQHDGVCCVYRITRDGETYAATMVQIIRIGFTADTSLWRSGEKDVRPHGNFCVDTSDNSYWGFVMRDAPKQTRVFGFALPSVHDGEVDAAYGVKTVTLNVGDIRKQFDIDYSNYIQGACMRDGIIYSVEGFVKEPNLPRMRIIDTRAECQAQVVELHAMGMPEEPEFVDFYKDTLVYSDCRGEMWTFTRY